MAEASEVAGAFSDDDDDMSFLLGLLAEPEVQLDDPSPPQPVLWSECGGDAAASSSDGLPLPMIGSTALPNEGSSALPVVNGTALPTLDASELPMADATAPLPQAHVQLLEARHASGRLHPPVAHRPVPMRTGRC